MIFFRKREIEVTLLFSYLLKTMPYYTVPLGSAMVDPRGTVHRTRGVRFGKL